MTIIEIRPHPWGWEVFESPGVEPVFDNEKSAIDYAQARAAFRAGAIRVLDAAGNVINSIPFDETSRGL